MARFRIPHIAAILAVASILFLLTALHNTQGLSKPKEQVLPKPPSFGSSPASTSQEPKLHLLIVATGSGLNLCRLLFSASVLNYPPPILIDWEGKGKFDAGASHLAKVAGPIRYFDTLPESADNDIVLFLDGFDIVLQLGPDVILKRYFESVKAANKILEDKYGASHVRKHSMYNTLLFGPDKMCFPLDFHRPACWAVPESPMPRYSFGPKTDKDMDHARPRWLNSGTLIGPIGDMRAMFRATDDKINKTFDWDVYQHFSDQMYFSDVWADQEFARMISKDGKVEIPMPKMVPNNIRHALHHPEFSEDEQVEYHLGLDYDSSMFQTFAGYKDYLSWNKFKEPAPSSNKKAVEPWRADLTQDVLDSPKPYAAVKDESDLEHTSWRNVSLGYNSVTGKVFPLLHYTGEKEYRDLWWSRMWYVQNAERLLRASFRMKDKFIGSGPIDGRRWQKFSPHKDPKAGNKDDMEVWGDQGQRLSWNGLCSSHEEDLFNTEAPDSGDPDPNP